MSGMSVGPPEDRQIQKKKSGFFQSHSPFRRRSQKSKDNIQPPLSTTATPTSRNTWTPATTRKAESANTSPTKSIGAGNRGSIWNKQPSPSADLDPVDPRADYQLGIGDNVFDVASPDSRRKPAARKEESGLDPIAQALAELKGVTKNASVRQSADRHYGMSTPAPGTERNMPAGAVPTPYANKSHRSTPPPGYEPPVSRLGAPQPAHTKREMQKTTEQYVSQNRTMFNAGSSRPGSSMGREPPRAASPQPARSASPRPFVNGDQRQQQPYRATSPNPYGGPPSAASRPRAQSSSPTKAGSSYGNFAPRGSSPGYQAPRAVSPNPAYNRPTANSSNHNSRPPSSRGSDNGGMALQLAPAPSGGSDPYGSQRGGRPQSQHYPSDGGYGNDKVSSRVRSQSQGTQRQFTKDGRPILHYGKLHNPFKSAKY